MPSSNYILSSANSAVVDIKHIPTGPYSYWLGANTTEEQRIGVLFFIVSMFLMVLVIVGVTLVLSLYLAYSSFLLS